MKKVTIFILLTVLVLMGVEVRGLWAKPDGELTERFEGVGRYDIVAGGVGLYGTTFGDIDLNVPGTVIQAYLYWAGYDTDPGGDDTVDFAIDGGPATTLIADFIYGPDFWYNPDGVDYYHYVYVEDVTSLVLSGSYTYSITDVDIGHNYGAGLMVVYENPSLPVNTVKIHDGLDSAHFRFIPPQGPDSEVTYVDVGAGAMGITLFVGGVQHDDRPNAIWYQTGTGPKPTNLVDEPDATELDGPPKPYPLGAYDGVEWDTYTGTIPVPASDTWAGIQIESVDTEEPYGPNDEGLGCSALFVAAGFVQQRESVGGLIMWNPMKFSTMAILALVAVFTTLVIIGKKK